jgi:hypothetical protein
MLGVERSGYKTKLPALGVPVRTLVAFEGH